MASASNAYDSQLSFLLRVSHIEACLRVRVHALSLRTAQEYVPLVFTYITRYVHYAYVCTVGLIPGTSFAPFVSLRGPFPLNYS